LITSNNYITLDTGMIGCRFPKGPTRCRQTPR